MFARFFSLITTIFTSLILFPPHDGALQALLWGPKLLASALSPQLALLGGLFGVVGIRRKDWLVSAVGLLGQRSRPNTRPKQTPTIWSNSWH